MVCHDLPYNHKYNSKFISILRYIYVLKYNQLGFFVITIHFESCFNDICKTTLGHLIQWNNFAMNIGKNGMELIVTFISQTWVSSQEFKILSIISTCMTLDDC